MGQPVGMSLGGLPLVYFILLNLPFDESSPDLIKLLRLYYAS